MYDILPFPNITATDTKEQVAQINNYLIQFKEELEFILTNIGEDNLSDNLVQVLHSLQNNTQVSTDDEALQQVVQKSLKITDVINSQIFKDETIKGVKVNGTLLEKDAERAVNVEVPTDYIVSGEQTTISEESGGLNVYTFTNANGETDTFEVRNGVKGEKGDKGDTGASGADGAKGDTGATGADGVSCTHSWSGTTLTVTSASGSSSANLKGDKGDKGDTGATGADGKTPTITLSVNFTTGNLEYTSS